MRAVIAAGIVCLPLAVPPVAAHGEGDVYAGFPVTATGYDGSSRTSVSHGGKIARPLLRAFHKVHHSAAALTPLTVYWTDPFEAVVFGLRSVAVQASTVSVFVFSSAARSIFSSFSRSGIGSAEACSSRRRTTTCGTG